MNRSREKSSSPTRAVSYNEAMAANRANRQPANRYPTRHNIFTKHHHGQEEPKIDVHQQMDDVTQAFKSKLQTKETLQPPKPKKRIETIQASEQETETEESEETSEDTDDSGEEEDSEEERETSVVAEFLTKLWRRQEMCDLILKSGKYELLAHKIPLAAYSQQFTEQCIAEVPTGPCEVTLTETTIEAVQEILKYIYTHEIDLNLSNIDPVISAARQLGVTDVINAARKYVFYFDEDTVIDLVWIAEKYEWLDICSRLFDYICGNFVDVCKEESFLRSPVDKVIRLLKEDNLNVNKELEVYFVATNWLDYNRQERKKYTQDVLNTVRFALITPDDIVKYVEPNMKYYSEECGVMLTNVFRFHALRYSGGASDGDLPKHRRYHPIEFYDKVTGIGIVSTDDDTKDDEDEDDEEEEAEEEETESEETEEEETTEEETESVEEEETEEESQD